MRILVATDQWFPDRMGGVARVATDTARGWAARGHEVVVIAPRHDDAPEETVDDRLRVLRVLPRGRLPQTLTDPVATRRHASRLRERTFDVVVAHSATSARGLLAAGFDAPFVYVFHADAAKEARYLRGKIKLGSDWFATVAFEGRLRRLTQQAIRAASPAIVLSNFSREVLSENDPAAADRAVLVSAGVDTTFFTPAGRDEARAQLGIDTGTRLVFTVRRLEPRMGIENLLAATALLDDVPDLRVVVVGSGRAAGLSALRDRLGVASRIDLVGRVTDDELALWHRAADLFVLPTVAYEGFGLATAEALASGTPVVGTPVGATPELLAPLEPRLIARDAEAPGLAEAIRTGLRLATPAFRARCRDYALATLSWEAVLPSWERVIENAVQRHLLRLEAAPAAKLHAVEDP